MIIIIIFRQCIVGPEISRLLQKEIDLEDRQSFAKKIISCEPKILKLVQNISDISRNVT